jgi:hypothetical protein
MIRFLLGLVFGGQDFEPKMFLPCSNIQSPPIIIPGINDNE